MLTLAATDGALRVAVWDTRAGSASRFTVPKGYSARLVRGGVVVSRTVTSADRDKRTSLYARSGRLIRHLGVVGSGIEVSADGRRLVSTGGGKVRVHDARTGAPQHSVAEPQGKSCYTGYQYDKTSFVVQCAPDGDGTVDAERYGAYRLPLAGEGKITPLLSDKAYGVRYLIRVRQGDVYARGSAAECPLPMWSHEGEPKALNPSGNATEPKRNDLTLVGAHHDSVYLSGFSTCAKPGGLVRYTLSAGKVRHLVGQVAPIKGVVSSAATVDDT